jgi:pyridoxine 5-phosphate synthase
MRFYFNVDHVATVREARRTTEPDPVEAALAAEAAGVHGITAHLREDRRHIQDDDIRRLIKSVTTVLNLELACTNEMLRIAEDLCPWQVTFVPERREEVTTEGGLDVLGAGPLLAEGVARLNGAGIRTSLFIDPEPAAVRRSRDLGAAAVELHTGRYAHNPGQATVAALAAAAAEGVRAGLAVHAGHGLTSMNVGPVAAISEIEELNIGHHIVSRAIIVGVREAVGEMIDAIRAARGEVGG